MSNLKGKVSLLLAIMMMMMTILPLAVVNAVEMSLIVKYSGVQLSDGQTLTVNPGATIEVNVETPYTEGLEIAYYWNAGNIHTFPLGDKTATITIPSAAAGSNNTLQVQAIINDNTHNVHEVIGKYKYTIMIPGTEKDTTITTDLLYNGSSVSTSKTVELPVNAKLYIEAESNNGVSAMVYRWDNEGLMEFPANAARGVLYVPNYAEGSVHTLKVQAKATDGTKSSPKTYTIRIGASAQVTDPEIDDELIVEPWMKESNDLEEVAVSLRSAAEENEKANQNIFSLGEEVTYYVDYKNGTSKTKKDVELVLELPLSVTVVDACGGVVDGNTITWTFPNGLEEDEAGTKTVVVKYKSLGKSSVKAKKVYPTADIYVGSKVVDSSSVINLIFKDEDTEIVNDEHYAYMFGDAGTTLFRPDDGITRAEGALVLTRIFGMNTSGVMITNLYPDLGETYEEAQKAIVAATNAGLINGYTDGTYRPNEKMTRAEFMKIIAANLELDAEDEDVRGIVVKDSTEEIKIYKNPTKSYVVNGSTVTEHWASPYVTLLARLNMTDLTSKNKDLRLDEYITRAEVAQLVNFYLFRAPAEVSSKTKSGFSDVSKNHKLFADIVEATREAHTYSFTLEGTEVAVDD